MMLGLMRHRSRSSNSRSESTENSLQLSTDSFGLWEVSGPMVLGSSADSDLCLKDAETRHAEIYRLGNLWWVRDLGSETGTYLNGEIVDAAPLNPAAELQLGCDGPVVHLNYGRAA